MPGKTLIAYNIKGGKYSIDGTTVKDLGFLAGITLDKNMSTKDIYGDGELKLSLISDKGSTGSLEMTTHDEDFETDLEFLKAIAQGTAQVQILQNKNVSIGFETNITDDLGTTKTKKVWLLGVNVAPAGESLTQNTETINEATCSYPLTIKGVNLKDSTGSADFVDANGNTLKVYKISSVPTDTGYATFLDSVPEPKANA